jgi:hypothetical protein
MPSRQDAKIWSGSFWASPKMKAIETAIAMGGPDYRPDGLDTPVLKALLHSPEAMADVGPDTPQSPLFNRSTSESSGSDTSAPQR